MKHKKTWIAVLACLLFVLIWIVTKYVEGSEVSRDPVKVMQKMIADIERQSGQSPFATPSVALPATPVQTSNVYALPPDPGPEGMNTLLGIDTNHNGVRDDTERFIVQKYGDSERVREALFDYARIDRGYLSSTTRAEALAASEKGDNAQNCVRYNMGGVLASNGISKWIQATRELEALMINTPERARAYQKSNELLSGSGSDARKADASDCSFNPQSLKN